MPLCIFELLISYIRAKKAGRSLTKLQLGKELGLDPTTIHRRFQSAQALNILSKWFELTPFGVSLLKDCIAKRDDVIFTNYTAVSKQSGLPSANYRLLPHWEYVQAYNNVRLRGQNYSDDRENQNSPDSSAARLAPQT